MIGCDVVGCEERASVGGIFEHKPNGMPPVHPIYYYCDMHIAGLDEAIQTWAVERTA